MRGLSCLLIPGLKHWNNVGHHLTDHRLRIDMGAINPNGVVRGPKRARPPAVILISLKHVSGNIFQGDGCLWRHFVAPTGSHTRVWRPENLISASGNITVPMCLGLHTPGPCLFPFPAAYPEESFAQRVWRKQRKPSWRFRGSDLIRNIPIIPKQAKPVFYTHAGSNRIPSGALSALHHPQNRCCL